MSPAGSGIDDDTTPNAVPPAITRAPATPAITSPMRLFTLPLLWDGSGPPAPRGPMLCGRSACWENAGPSSVAHHGSTVVFGCASAWPRRRVGRWSPRPPVTRLVPHRRCGSAVRHDTLVAEATAPALSSRLAARIG